MMGAYSTLQNYTKQVMKDLEKADKDLRGKAGRHVRSRIRAKINKEQPSLPGQPPGKVTGNLLKGLAVKNGTPSTLVGFKAPGYHARMLEFGTLRMAARPVLFTTMAEEAETVKRIMSGDWVK